MKTRDEAHADLDRWIDTDCVGNLTIFRAPHSDKVDSVIEQTVKAREMDTQTRAAFENFMSKFPSVTKGEFYRDVNGKPDRVKLVRSFDD